MKVNILKLLGFKLKVQLWFKNNSTPFVMYVQNLEYKRSDEKFIKITWVQTTEKYQFNIGDVIAIKHKTVWKPF